MPPKEIARSIRLPQHLWDALDRDAKRCLRSSVKQLEAVLTTYYAAGDVEIGTAQHDTGINGKKLAPNSGAMMKMHKTVVSKGVTKKKTG